ncbi:hypothetical protein Bca101_097383 [Brassica carinata]
MQRSFNVNHDCECVVLIVTLGSNTKIHFNAFDALAGWKQEGLPPVEVPAAAKWKFRSKPSQQVILDYDYTFTTPYCGSGVVEKDQETVVLYEDELADNGVSLLTVKVIHMFDHRGEIDHKSQGKSRSRWCQSCQLGCG